MKKFLAALILSLALTVFSQGSVSAQEAIICPQPYGGGVVCGTKTHEPVETGLGENLALIGGLSIGLSGILLYLSKKTKTSQV